VRHFEERGLVRTVDAEQGVEAVFRDVQEIFERSISGLPAR